MERLPNCLFTLTWCILLLTNLSKAFVCISHDLLIAKRHAYTDSLRLIHSYLSERQQRSKIDSTFSSYADIN